MINRIILQRFICYIVLISSLLILTGNTSADVALSADNLNGSLKEIERIQRKLKAAPVQTQTEMIFQLGIKADDLAMQLTGHMLVYGEEQKGLIDLVLDRTAELDVIIHWYADKQRYFYDGAAFVQYLALTPAGPNAAESAYQLLETGFFRSSGEDLESLLALVKHKLEYLQQYPDANRTAEVRIMLAIEYRDLSLIHLENEQLDKALHFGNMARDETKRVIETYANTRQATVAEELLARIEADLQKFQPANN